MVQSNNILMPGKFRIYTIIAFLIPFGALILSGTLYADALFRGRQINLGNESLRTFSLGVTGTTAGHNYFALRENARQEAISLGELGFWELVPDPPSYLRNYDLQMMIEKKYTGRFLIEFEYRDDQKDILFHVKQGDISVKVYEDGYYPRLVIEDKSSASDIIRRSAGEGERGNLVFFDFNSLDVDLRRYYGKIKEQLEDQSYVHYFYYYESGNHNSYYFKIYSNVNEMDTDKMGLSSENGNLKYYQEVLDNIRSHLGNGFTGKITVITRFGRRFSYQLKEYASEIGASADVDVTFLSYDDIPL